MDEINQHYDEDDTAPIVPFGRRSGKSRANETTGQGNATFLTECSFGVAHDKLVQLITDVQPFEPYWETLKSIDLRGRSVDNLARLKEFLPKLEEVLLYVQLVEFRMLADDIGMEIGYLTFPDCLLQSSIYMLRTTSCRA
jgi:hypothetical protein